MCEAGGQWTEDSGSLPLHESNEKTGTINVWGFSKQFFSLVKNPPATQGMQVQSLGREDPLEKEMATHSCILAWEIPWTEEHGGSTGSQKSET